MMGAMGRDGARYDAATGLYWLAVRVYDPTLGRFLSRDPLNRAPLFVTDDNPYVYAGNDPVSNIDPSGQYRAAGFGSTARESGQATNQQMARIQAVSGCDKACKAQRQQVWDTCHGGLARDEDKAAKTCLGTEFSQPTPACQFRNALASRFTRIVYASSRAVHIGFPPLA